MAMPSVTKAAAPRAIAPPGVDTAFKTSEKTLMPFPATNSPAPIPATLTTVSRKVLTVSGSSPLSQSEASSKKLRALLIHSMTLSLDTSEMEIFNSSNALFSVRALPPMPLSSVSAFRCVAPADAPIFSSRSGYWPSSSINPMTAGYVRFPKTLYSTFAFSSSAMPSVAFFRSVRISTMGRTFPVASTVSSPIFSMAADALFKSMPSSVSSSSSSLISSEFISVAAFFVGASKLIIMFRALMPPVVPFMFRFASMPRNANSSLSPPAKRRPAAPILLTPSIISFTFVLLASAAVTTLSM